MTTRRIQTIREVEVQTVSFAEFGVNTLKEKGTSTTRNMLHDLLNQPKIMYPSQQKINKYEGIL